MNIFNEISRILCMVIFSLKKDGKKVNIVSFYFLYFLCALILSFPLNLMAKDLFVSPSGSDSIPYESNSIDTPWATPAKAWYNAQAGDNIYFRGGTYGISSTVDTNGLNGNNGTETNPITFKPYNGESVTFMATGGRGPMFQISKDYNIVEGFRIDLNNYFSVGFAVGWYNGDSDVTGFVADGLIISNWNDGDNHNAFYIGSSYADVTATKITIKNCTLTGYSSGANQNYSGIQVFGATEFIIENNDISQVRRGIYIKHSSYGYSDHDDLIINNYIHHLNSGAYGIRVNGNYIDIKNNIVDGSVQVGEDAESGDNPNGTFNTFDHNTITGGLEQFYDGWGTNNTYTNNIILKSFFVFGYSTNPENPVIIETNYNLYGGSPAITHHSNSFFLFQWQSHLASDGTGGSRDAKSVIGTPTFEGGTSPLSIAGFALTSSSPGYQSASDGSDIGADVFLVGVGVDSSEEVPPPLVMPSSKPAPPLSFQLADVLSASSLTNECLNYESMHPEWIFCDDFEVTSSFVRDGRYFEYNDDNGEFVPVEKVGVNESIGMQVKWQSGEVDAGSLALGFGRNPSDYMNKGIRSNEDFREIYYRIYVKHGIGWSGSPTKLSRVSVISSSDWSQAMIAHNWAGDSNTEVLAIDPASCVIGSDVQCVGWNDFDHLQWLGHQDGITPIFNSAQSDQWACVEVHVKLNDPGQANGINEFWVNGQLEARRDNLDFTDFYTDYSLNYLSFENYWNTGSVKDQSRYLDNIVVSTTRIGCQ